MNIFMTGGLGFVGTYCASLLKNTAHTIRIYDKQAMPETYALPELRAGFVQGDIRDLDTLVKASHNCDAIIHLAAEHKDNVQPISLYDDVNIEGTRNVCRAASKNGIKTIIFTSSVAVYGLNNTADETTPPKPFNDYGRTKLAAEDVLREWQAQDPERCLIIIRPTVIFGENNRGNVYNLLRQLIIGPFVMIGAGNNKKAMAYVGNIADFIVTRLTDIKAGYELFNYVDKPDLSINELIALVDQITGKSNAKSRRIPYGVAMCATWGLDLIAKVLHKEFPISQVRVKKFTANTLFGTKGLEKMAYTPPYDMLKALERTITAEFPATKKD